MVGVPRVIRSCIDSFADDLIELAKALAAQEISRAMAAHQKDARRAEREARRAEKLAARTESAERRRKERERSHAEKAQARLERAAERRRQLEARRVSLGFDPTNEAKRRTRRAPENNRAPAPASPPPLFVHKRRRDGQIQALTRPADETPAQPSSPASAQAPPAPPA
jgi:hypothetical protein